MKKTLTLGVIGIVLVSLTGLAVQLETISLGFHVIPSVDKVDGDRVWALTLSFGARLELDSKSSIDFLAMVDSGPSSLGTSAQFNQRITDPLTAGAGFTVLWPFSMDLGLQWPILGLYAHAVGRTYFYPEFWAEASISFPLLTLANQIDGWKLLPMAELPSLYIAADAKFVDQASIQPRLTLQPVITDTTLLQNPIGRISDDLLIIPMGSVFLRYLR